MGLEAQGDFPKHQKCSGTLIVCGSGHTLWDDLYSIKPLKWDIGDLMAVNDAGMHLPHALKHWYSNDEWISRWRNARRPRFVVEGAAQDTKGETIILHTNNGWPGCLKWPWHGGGTSSLGAVFTGLALGYGEIIICGVPMDDGPHYFDPPNMKTNFDRELNDRAWADAKSRYFAGRVRAVSGKLKELLKS